MAMTRAGAVLARRLVKATASPGPGHLDYVARRLGRPSPRPLEGSLGDALAICRRRLSSSPRAPATPPPPPPTPSPPPPKSWLLGKPSPQLLEGSLGEALAICRRRFSSSPRAPATPPPPPTKSWLDLSINVILSKIRKMDEVRQTLWGVISVLFACQLGSGHFFNSRVKVDVHKKLADHDVKRAEAKKEQLHAREDARRHERQKREDTHRHINSVIDGISSKLFELEEKELTHRHKVLEAQELLSKLGISEDDDLPVAMMKKVDNLESEVRELKILLAKSAGLDVKYVEIGDQLSQLESKVSSLKSIVKADKLSKSATTEPESGASKGP